MCVEGRLSIDLTNSFPKWSLHGGSTLVGALFKALVSCGVLFYTFIDVDIATLGPAYFKLCCCTHLVLLFL
jgi:hypothetical protein